MTTPRPPARRRTVRKAAKPDELMAVYDQTGALLGTCRISDVQELAQHPASKPEQPAGGRPQPSAALTRELDASKRQGPPNTLQPQPSDAAGTPKTARPSSAGQVAKSASRAGLRLADSAEVAIAKRAADAVRRAAEAGQTPAGVATVRAHAAGQAVEELRQYRAARAAVIPPAPVRKTTTGEPERSWEAAQAELKRLRGGV